MDDSGTQPTKSDAATREERILSFWKENRIFEKSLEKKAPNGEFVFYEGPPGANGLPHMGHFETRAFKDAFPRYKTMRGYHVPRRAGWDTHGLPVELEVEKQLGFSGKKDIEAYGIGAFNEKCRESAFTYINEWEKITERMGYWVDFKKAYFTFEPAFMESVWWVMKQIADAQRLYKDYKVLPWCPVCGTALSSHELAQGYEDVKDLTITAKFELVDEPGTYFLAWTTTPWTLPGNIALAVGKDIEYAKVRTDDGTYLVATDRIEAVCKDTTHEIVGSVKGKELEGKEYKPLYPFASQIAPQSEQSKFKNAYKVHLADFVTTEDGTGIVHTAVMYGQDDFELGQNVGLPKVHLVAPDGHFVPGTGFLEGKSVIDETTNVEILKDLQAKDAVFSKESYTHSYPHCWRSKNRLIYYARDSWFIRMHDLREKLVEANRTVHWEPGYIQEGRMGEWLAGAKEWAISRERYWGTPLPVWENKDKTERVVVGSVDDLKRRIKKSGNRYLVMRHGESENNAKDMLDSTNNLAYKLTDNGRAQVEAAAAGLTSANVTKIVASPFERTKETAKIIAKALHIAEDKVVYDDRLREFDFGSLDGTSHSAFNATKSELRLTDPVGGGDSYQTARSRFGEFLYDLEASLQNETILIVTHGIGVESLTALAEGRSFQKGFASDLPQTVLGHAKVYDIPFVPLPHNEDYDLDLHRPYIDEVVLISDSGAELRRVSEVMDVWFDSGAMPFAQDHYPFENKEWIDTKGYPADFICEAIDQTRGWFYTLLAVGVLIDRGAPFKNVICLGHVLDEHGQKMSKSKGNVVHPQEAMEEWGADVLRFWMYSVNQPGDSMNFDPKTVKESARVLSWLENSAKFYELFRDGASEGNEQAIDRWILARLSEAVTNVTENMDAYRPYEATRALAGLFEDLSQWYVRRIRERVRDGDAVALRTLRRVVRDSALMLAPFSPFIAEDLYQIVKEEDDPESVHLASWPESQQQNRHDAGPLIDEMRLVRELASQALMLRQKEGVKVRQPLASLAIVDSLSSDDLREILREEVNVKEITENASEMKLDMKLTPELIAEGDERAFQRAVAEARKAENLSPKDTAEVERRDDGAYAVELSMGTVRFSLKRL